MTSNPLNSNNEPNRVDSTRGNLLTDLQQASDSVPMKSASRIIALNDSTTHEIRSILERPVQIGTYSWDSSQQQLPIHLKYSDYAADTNFAIQTLDYPQTIFENSPLVVDKLKNYQYFKADVEVEIKINAQPFLQGALMLVYAPYDKQISEFRRKGTKYLASQTSFPHKIVRVEDGASLKLTFPYCNIYDLFDLSNPDNQFGTVYLYVFSTLIGSEVASCDYTIFSRFVNPQFFVPTGNATLVNMRNQHDIKRLESQGYRVAQSDVAPQAPADTGEVTATGPVSKIATGIAMVSDVLSSVPAVGKIASSVAWVSRSIAKTAATFGWSKPTSIIPQQKMVIKPGCSIIHTEGNDDSTTLALIQDNGIDGSAGNPEVADEMALSHIFARPNYFHAKTADETLFINNNLITAWEVSPFSQYQYGENESSQSLYLGSFAYTCMQATLWRGTLNYDIMLIKTMYHKGRFAVVYFPETNLADMPLVLNDELNTNYNVICDLTDPLDPETTTVYRIPIPYMSNVPWRECYKRDVTGFGPDATTLDTKTGCVGIYALNKLSFPPTVPNNITFYIAHSGGADFEIARPLMTLSPGFQGIEGVRVAQSDIGPVVIAEPSASLVPSSSSKDVTAQTTGEYFHSLRALIKRFGRPYFFKNDPDFVGIKSVNFAENPENGIRISSLGTIRLAISPTPWYMVSFLYRFYNGSSNLKILPSAPWHVVESFLSIDEDRSHQVFNFDSIENGQPIFEQLQNNSCLYEIRSPYYRGVVMDVVGTTQTPILGAPRTNIRYTNNSGIGGGEFFASTYEAAGDDFNFLFLIGPCVMQDIANAPTGGSLPAGVTTTATVSTVTGGVPTGNGSTFSPMALSPSVVLPAGYTGFYTDSKQAFTVHYDDLTTELVTLGECGFNTASGFVVPKALGKTMDEALTLPNIQALAPFRCRVLP